MSVRIKGKTLKFIRRRAITASPVECGGIVSGRKYGGVFTVAKCYQAKTIPSETNTIHIKIDPLDLPRIDEIRKREGTGIFIGWWHSHPIGASLSGEDVRTTRAMAAFASDDQVAVVVDSIRPDQVTAFVVTRDGEARREHITVV